MTYGPGACRPGAAAGPATARLGNGPDDGAVRQRAYSLHGCHWKGWGGRQRPRRAACDSDSLPPKQEDAPSPGPARRSPRCYRLAAAPLNDVSGQQLPS